MSDDDVTIRGLQEAQRDNQRMIAALLGGPHVDGLKAAAFDAQRYLMSITHVITGSLRASSRIQIQGFGRSAVARLYVDPAAVNPRTGAHPADYVRAEEARGGSHAAWSRTVTEHHSSIATTYWTTFRRGLP
jgi:nucleoid DNA-binding protein